MRASTRPDLRNRAWAGLLLALLAIPVSGCEDGSDAEPPPPTAAGTVRQAAAKTLVAEPAGITMKVSSKTAAYSVRGGIDLARSRFRVRARVAEAPITHFPKELQVIGLDGDAYQITRGDLGFGDIGTAGCAFDPHGLIGSFGGAASVQESIALVGIATRLLRDAPRQATLVERRDGRGATYRVRVHPHAVSDPHTELGDEWIVVNPPRLARHLGPMQVTIDADGRIHRLLLELRRFRPPSPGPRRTRDHRRERVSISVLLSDFGRTLEVRRPACVAME